MKQVRKQKLNKKSLLQIVTDLQEVTHLLIEILSILPLEQREAVI